MMFNRSLQCTGYRPLKPQESYNIANKKKILQLSLWSSSPCFPSPLTCRVPHGLVPRKANRTRCNKEITCPFPTVNQQWILYPHKHTHSQKLKKKKTCATSFLVYPKTPIHHNTMVSARRKRQRINKSKWWVRQSPWLYLCFYIQSSFPNYPA